MKVELEITKEELKEFLEILEDIAHNSGMNLPVVEGILGQLLEKTYGEEK